MNTPPTPRYRIFLSHSAHDAPLVRGIKAQVEAVGIDVYLYEEHSEPGRSVPEKLQQAIRQHDALVALLTSASGHRPFIHDEIGFALGAGKPAVALVTPDVTDNEVLGMLQGEYITLDPAFPFDGMAKLLTYLSQQAAARKATSGDRQAQTQIDLLVQAILLVAAAIVIGYAFYQLASPSAAQQ